MLIFTRPAYAQHLSHQMHLIAHRGIARAARTHNAYSPIYTLPVELTVMIFSQLAMHDRVHAACVSQRLRNIALGTPVLWSDISLDKHSCAGVMGLLERSKDAPLSIESRSNSSHSQLMKKAAYIFVHAKHIKSLVCSGLVSIIPGVLQQPRANSLVTLRLQGVDPASSLLLLNQRLVFPELQDLWLSDVTLPE